MCVHAPSQSLAARGELQAIRLAQVESDFSNTLNLSDVKDAKDAKDAKYAKYAKTEWNSGCTRSGTDISHWTKTQRRQQQHRRADRRQSNGYCEGDDGGGGEGEGKSTSLSSPSSPSSSSSSSSSSSPPPSYGYGHRREKKQIAESRARGVRRNLEFNTPGQNDLGRTGQTNMTSIGSRHSSTPANRRDLSVSDSCSGRGSDSGSDGSGSDTGPEGQGGVQRDRKADSNIGVLSGGAFSAGHDHGSRGGGRGASLWSQSLAISRARLRAAVSAAAAESKMNAAKIAE